MKKTRNIHSVDETICLANQLATLLPDHALLTLSGDLGAGKTTFTKALGKAMGVKKVINSPTFTILKSYTMSDGQIFHHIDAYRLEGVQQNLGFDEIYEDDGICVVEWPQFIDEQLPKERLSITIVYVSDDERDFEFEPIGKEYDAIVEAL